MRLLLSDGRTPTLEELVPELAGAEPPDLAHLFFRDGEAGEGAEVDRTDGDGKVQLVEKVILRTGTWKIRPTPDGPLRKPLKVFRDKAPKGHISMSELKKNFDAGVIEHVAVPVGHTDDPTANTGYVRTLRIKDLDDGSAQLIAGIEFTEPDVEGKVKRKSIPNVSSGVLFNFLHKETGKRFQQVLDHVCLTRRPWINGMPAFGAALSDEPIETDGEFDFFSETLLEVKATETKLDTKRSRFTDEQYERSCILKGEDGKPMLPVREPTGEFSLPAMEAAAVQLASDAIQRLASEDEITLAKARLIAYSRALGVEPPKMAKLADPPKLDENEGPASGTVVWKPEEGSGWIRSQVNRRLSEMRSALLRNRIGCDDVIPYYRASDVAGDKVLITAGYGDEQEAWIAKFKVEDSSVVLDSYDDWIPARQEWVAAAQSLEEQESPSGRAPRGNGTPPAVRLSERNPLALAQAAREDRLGQRSRGRPRPQGGKMALKLSDMLARGLIDRASLSDEQVEELEREEREQEARDTELAELRAEKREGKAKEVVQKAKSLGLNTPGFAKALRNVVKSDDGGAALEFAEFDDSGKKVTAGQRMTATEIVETLLDALPRDKEGRLTLSDQVREDPDDEKPPEEREDAEGEKEKGTPEERAAKLEDELNLPWKREEAASSSTGGDGR